VEEKQIKILERIEFETNEATIRSESEDVLQAVRKILEEHPQITRISIEGHTDNVGKAAYNKRLSDRRAAAVVKWLVDHGIGKKRLRSKGFGLERPIADNDSEEGRQQNRRVEFHIKKVDGKDPADSGRVEEDL
ncbi:MAG: OmpA family protein, partial [Myxococcales bacterium]|nr:OmpA family protein [Myxococcales bacterium]